MKKTFALGAASGITALAIGFPIAAQFAGAQEATLDSETSASVGADAETEHEMRFGMKHGPLSQDDVRAMIDRDNAILLNVDALVSIHKEAIQSHRIALEAAADITDETERNDAVRAAHEAMRAEVHAAIEANPELKDAMPFGHMGFGPGHRGKGMMKMKHNFEEKFGMTAEELKAEIDSGKTIHEIAEERGVELPERPAGARMGR